MDDDQKKEGAGQAGPVQTASDCSAIEQELGTSLGPLLDAFSLGLSDQGAAELAEVSEHDVQELRAKLGQVGSSLGLSFKKPICQQKKDQPE